MDTGKKHLGTSTILLIYLALKPLYFGASGSVQICDLFLVIATCYLIAKCRGKIRIDGGSRKVLLCFILLCIYQFIANMIWSVKTGTNMNKATLYYVFNCIAFADFLIIANRESKDSVKTAVSWGVGLSVLVTDLSLILIKGTSGRRTGFFNNPNQLGYFGIVAASFLLLCNEKINKKVYIFLHLSIIWIVICSNSKAALVSLAAVYSLHVLLSGKKNSIKSVAMKLLFIIAMFSAVYILLFSEIEFITSNNIISLLRYRLFNMTSENDSSLGEGRGYDRVFEMGHHIFFGMGEGAFDRFETLRGLESHSSYITIFVSYGVVGFIIYLYLMLKSLLHKKRIINNLICYSGVLLYGLTHNGLRNTTSWMLLAFILVDSIRSYKNSESSTVMLKEYHHGDVSDSIIDELPKS